MGNRKRIGMIAIGAVFCLLMGAPLFAAVVNPGDTVSFAFASNHASGFPGGAFLAYDSTTHSSWYSFCLEYNEYISLGANYTVNSVIPAAVNGGVDGGNPDPISSQTAYLFYLYATGGIAGVTGAGTGEQQAALQNVFWYLENEIAALPSNSLTAQYLALAQTADAGQFYGVLVVNPVTAAGGLAQSQLVYVPEPGTLMLLGTGLLCLFGYQRSRRTV
jgi:PEP-CTERM motif